MQLLGKKKGRILLVLLGIIFAAAIYFLNADKIDAKINLASKKSKFLKETMFYKKLQDFRVQCSICFRQCIIPEGKRGFCRNRENKKGVLYNIVYARPSAVQIDPIEKEPQLHMLPGTNILCFGTAGCNFRCKFCHN